MLLGILLSLAAQFGQTSAGELRLAVTDPSGLPVACAVQIVSEAQQVAQDLTTTRDGTLTVRRLPPGKYRLQVTHDGFETYVALVEVGVALPTSYRVTLRVANVSSTVDVSPADTLLDPQQIGPVRRVGSAQVDRRVASLPGRSVSDLVNTQPGWLLEANGILHPRGSEYQVQYVIDGLPITDNRSPAFAPEIEADDVGLMTIFTGGYPAEFGRKLGGVIDVVTDHQGREGLHGDTSIGIGGFGTAGASANAQYGWRRTTLSVGGSAARTDRYLDPPVEQNYTNAGSTTSASAGIDRDLTDRDRLSAVLRHGGTRFEVPNEQVQQDAGQQQHRSSGETGLALSYHHIFSSHVLGDVHLLTRDLTAALWSNERATPIVANQDRGFTETYVKGTLSAHYGQHDVKAGIEVDFSRIRERFDYDITNPDAFDPDTPPSFAFADRRDAREQAAFIQDVLRLGNWTLSAGLRWDHYDLLVDRHHVSPRLGVAWYWPSADLVVRASYDRAFQTPAVENLLLASSPELDALSESVLRLPVEPSTGDFYEVGFSKRLFGHLRVDASHYRRDMTNFADDDLLLNTGVSFPIAFSRAHVDGTEVSIELPRVRHWWGSANYSNMNGVGYLPITGGLLLGDEAASEGESERFPISQDQRHTVRGRIGYDLTSRAWVALAGSYGSGLPVEAEGDLDAAIAQYGPRTLSRVDFDAGRVKPSYSFDASGSLVLAKSGDRSIRLQVDVTNLTNHFNVINFAGLFSGTALGVPRTIAMRLQARF